MLKAACDAAPRGLYVCGNSSTSAGLTVSVKKEAGKDGEFTFEAGAAVLADRGVCEWPPLQPARDQCPAPEASSSLAVATLSTVCVDEFDKMRADHGALLEVMEQQEVSMAKAGMVASLPARATVVAAANPTKGHYDPSKDVSQVRYGIRSLTS